MAIAESIRVQGLSFVCVGFCFTLIVSILFLPRSPSNNPPCFIQKLWHLRYFTFGKPPVMSPFSFGLPTRWQLPGLSYHPGTSPSCSPDGNHCVWNFLFTFLGFRLYFVEYVINNFLKWCIEFLYNLKKVFIPY